MGGKRGVVFSMDQALLLDLEAAAKTEQKILIVVPVFVEYIFLERGWRVPRINEQI